MTKTRTKKKIVIEKNKSEMIGVRLETDIALRLKDLAKKHAVAVSTIAGYILTREIDNYD